MSRPVRWQAQIAMINDAIPFRIGTTEDDVIAEWTGIARLVARRDGSRSELVAEPGADPRSIEKIRRGSAFLLLRDLAGKAALHGAAVGIADRSAVFLGRSGQGKSTLAAALCRAGAALLADDAVALEPGPTEGSWLVTPQESDHWLGADAQVALGVAPARGGKSPIASASVAARPLRVGCFFALRFSGDRPRLTRLHGLEAASALVPQIARFVLDDPDRQRRELDLIHRLVEEIPCFALDRPLGFEHLSETIALVSDVVRSLAVQ